MFAVNEAAALAIRQACQDGGELSGVVELRRRFPGIADNARARLCLQAVMSWAPPAPNPDQGPDGPGSEPACAGRPGRGGSPLRAGKPSGAPGVRPLPPPDEVAGRVRDQAPPPLLPRNR